MMWAWLIRSFGHTGRKDEQLIKRFNEMLQNNRTFHAQDSLYLLQNEQTENVLYSVRKQTEECNRNNVTRTEAYFNFFQRYPEVHWAFLAHMVSRNGGWSMTDVKGSLLRPVLSREKARSFFDMFERSNWLIFHDAYPQLLLYAESVWRGEPLFHLLPCFGVSGFMVPVWQHFWQERDSSLLTLALIVNEQQYIEERVVQHPHYRSTVLRTVLFKLQTAFDFNQVIFPVDSETCQPRLAGRTMHNFPNVAHRIKTGRMLYQMLFHPDCYERIYSWAAEHPHTGSRADYWPERFTVTPTSEGNKVYSPILHDAWPDIEHRPAEKGDWYKGPSSLSVLIQTTAENEKNFYVTDVYERSYRRLQVISLLARTKNHLVRLKSPFDNRDRKK